jgi:hypothetical protein
MSTPLPPGFDLSKLPEPLRSKLQERLNRLSPEMRQQLLERGSSILDKGLERARQTPASLPRHGDGRYSATVQPGDRMHLSLGMLALILAAVAALYWLYG